MRSRIFAVAVLTVFAAPAFAETPVETYAGQTINKGIAILKDGTLSDKARQDAIRAYLQSALDIRRIALFALGPTARTAAPPDLAAYVQAFENFTLANYSSRVGAYGGQTLKVTSAAERSPGDFIVTVAIIDPKATAADPGDSAQFRVLSEPNGGFAIVDASVEGVWFEVAQRDDFQGYLAQNGGSLAKLIEHINQMTAQISAPAH